MSSIASSIFLVGTGRFSSARIMPARNLSSLKFCRAPLLFTTRGRRISAVS